MDVKIVSSITRLANYMPLGSYIIYTALETYSFSLGSIQTPITTIVQTPFGTNYTCYYTPPSDLIFSTCSSDQSDALKLSLAIGFFLSLILSFVKQVPQGSTPPLAPEPDADDGNDSDTLAGGDGAEKPMPPPTVRKVVRRRKNAPPRYRFGVIYAADSHYYLDFGSFAVWGHALLSTVAFGTLSLLSASVSQCLFPSVKPWIFVFTQVIMLVLCCFIAMFWLNDNSLSIGLLVVPATPTNPDGIFNLPSTGGAPVSRRVIIDSYHEEEQPQDPTMATMATGYGAMGGDKSNLIRSVSNSSNLSNGSNSPMDMDQRATQWYYATLNKAHHHRASGGGSGGGAGGVGSGRTLTRGSSSNSGAGGAHVHGHGHMGKGGGSRHSNNSDANTGSPPSSPPQAQSQTQSGLIRTRQALEQLQQQQQSSSSPTPPSGIVHTDSMETAVGESGGGGGKAEFRVDID